MEIYQMYGIDPVRYQLNPMGKAMAHDSCYSLYLHYQYLGKKYVS